jgi:hypothetical protein
MTQTGDHGPQTFIRVEGASREEFSNGPVSVLVFSFDFGQKIKTKKFEFRNLKKKKETVTEK